MIFNSILYLLFLAIAQISAIGLTIEDYYDTSHLNRLGAVKFTEYFIRDLVRLLGKEADWSSVGWAKGERCKKINDSCF